MRPLPSSSSFLHLLLLFLSALSGGLPVPVSGSCSDLLRAGRDGFVLDVERAVYTGAALLATARVPSAEECRSACCEDARCNVLLLETEGGDGLECTLFNCVHRNRFVCAFMRKSGFQSYVRESVYRKHLEGPQAGEKAPPIAVTGRDVIVQPGAVVRLNGSESLALDDAHITEYRWSQVGGDSSVGIQETGLRDQVILSNLLPGQYVFQLSITDSNSQSDAANASVLVLSQQNTSLFCGAPIRVGPCRASFTRWRYNVSTNSCQTFIYGGCKGNENNYLTQKDCESACKGSAVPLERMITPSTEECGSPCGPHQLVCKNGCCLDRRLECDNKTQCSDGSDEDHCSKLNQTFSDLLDLAVDERTANCTDPPKVGPCRASLTRFFYDPLQQECISFIYGGCSGNRNNFLEEDECKHKCRGVTEKDVYSRGLFERFERDDESNSGSVALAVVLSVSALVLLAVLSYCFLKSRKERSHRSTAASSAPVVLAEQDALVSTTTVYNQTTKPL